MKTKKSLIFGIGTFFLFLACFTSGWAARNNNFLVPAPLPTPTQIITPAPKSLLPSTSPLFSESFKVTRVVDGDTIEIEGEKKVRYIGIDTPETVDPRKPVQCFGLEAAKKNKELVEGKTVLLEKDITDKDKYSRLLRYVWVGELLVNLELVKQGFAFSYTYPPDIKYQKEFLAAEKEAREAKRGLWKACPVVALPTALSAAKIQETPKSGCDIKGNIGASGEKIYHLPGCGSYDKTRIDEKRGERLFCSEKEALGAGFRKALNCP